MSTQFDLIKKVILNVMSFVLISPNVLHRQLGNSSSNVICHVQQSCNRDSLINRKLNFVMLTNLEKFMFYFSTILLNFFTTWIDSHKYIRPHSICFKLRMQILDSLHKWFSLINLDRVQNSNILSSQPA